MKIIDVERKLGRFLLRIDRLFLEQGRVIGLIGPNGSGKTTVMKLMAGILAPDKGIIDYNGLTARDITMAPRRPYFLHDTVRNNLIYPLKLRSIKLQADEIDHWLEIAGLKDQQRQYAPSLSSGEQQKLSLVRAMIFSPKLILLDEAFSNLDLESIDRFERLILARQKADPITWVIVSHQIAHILRLCDDVIFMYEGRPEAEGSAETMLLTPQEPLLQRYLHAEAIIRRSGF